MASGKFGVYYIKLKLAGEQCVCVIRERLPRFDRLNRSITKMCSSESEVKSEDRLAEQDEGNQKVEHLSKRAQKRMEKFRKYKEMKKMKQSSGKNRNPGFGFDLYKETEYYFENGLRKVYPYYYTFTTYAKLRWYDRTILDVLSTEFRADSVQEYKNAIENGTVTVNGQAVTPDYRVKNNDLLANQVHRHENPVLATPIQVIANTDDILVINKPSSIPCHPCGQYRHNSIVFILGKELGCANLTNIYRLDRLTSGVLIMGKSASRTRELERQIAQRQVQKEYVCRVVGNFPEGTVEVKEPLECLSQKVGLFRIKAGGKESHTTFEKISFNGKSSIVKCMPHTGRTHQIRIHLQYLGYPIVNDPFYNSDAWGVERGKGGVYDYTEDEIIKRIMKKHYIGLWEDGDNPMFSERLQEEKDKLIEQESGNSHSPASKSRSDELTQTEVSEHSPEEPCAKKLRTNESVCSKLDLNCSSDIGSQSNSNHQISNNCDDRVQQITKADILFDTNVSNESSSMVDISDETNVNVKLSTKGDISDETEVGVQLSSKGNISDGTDVGFQLSTKGDISDGTDVNSHLSSDKTDVADRSSTTENCGINKDCNKRHGFDRLKWIPDPNCIRCKKHYTDPSPEELILYLHAFKYSGPDWEYSTSLPEWAKDDWNES